MSVVMEEKSSVGRYAGSRHGCWRSSRVRHRTLMDLQMPGLGGIQGIRELRQRWPAARVVVLTTYRGDANAHEALQAGALGYLLKSALRDELISCLLMVNEGKRHICAEVCSDIAAYIGGERLTPREKRILELMAEGLENKQIGDVLSISSETVKSHTCALFSKLNVHNRSEAVRVGWRRGMLMPPNR